VCEDIRAITFGVPLLLIARAGFCGLVRARRLSARENGSARHHSGITLRLDFVEGDDAQYQSVGCTVLTKHHVFCKIMVSPSLFLIRTAGGCLISVFRTGDEI